MSGANGIERKMRCFSFDSYLGKNVVRCYCKVISRHDSEAYIVFVEKKVSHFVHSPLPHVLN